MPLINTKRTTEYGRRNTDDGLRNTDDGFTLLEVLLAIVLAVSGLVVLLPAFSIGVFSGGDNENTLVAINLGQEKIEELRNKTYSAIANEAKAAVSGFAVFQREVVVTTALTGLKQVNVNVYWYAKSNETGISLAAYVSDI